MPPAARHQCRRTASWLCASAVILVLAAAVAPDSAAAGPITLDGSQAHAGSRASAGKPMGWDDASLQPVGGPIAVRGDVLVLDATKGRQLQLTAVRGSNGSTLWDMTVSASDVPPGVPLAPVAIGRTVLAMVSADGSPSDPNVLIEGVDVTSGRVIWKEAETPIVTDAPVACLGGKDFCVAAFTTSGTSTTVTLIDPATGKVNGTVAGPARSMASSRRGNNSGGDLWQTYSQAPTFIQLSASGQVAWQHSVAKIFGGAQYSPNYGWDFSVRGGLDVGSVGYPATSKKLVLDKFKTLGISTTDGSVRWSLPGFYMCGGTLEFLATDVACDYSGSVSQVGSSVKFAHLGLAMKGIDAATGKVTWVLRVKDAQGVMEGTEQGFLDGHRLAVETSNSKWAVLDTADGTTRPAGAGEVFWCQHFPGYKVTAPEGAATDGERISAAVFSGCSARGATSAGIPSTRPGDVGARAGGFFVWPSDRGLRAVPLR